MIHPTNDMSLIATRLKEEIKSGLPGSDIQWKMASSDRLAKDFPKTPGNDARIAAVLIILYPYVNSVYTVFMQRPEYNGIHSGQISFPGGRKESSDFSIIQTALREAKEETGINPGKISVIGTITPLFIPVSNMLVTPVLSYSYERPVFKYDSEEVLFLIEADIKKLLQRSIIKTKPFEIMGRTLKIKYFDYEGHVIWGATAMMLNELLEIIRRSKTL
jgi:8-oxo-dGTP pyrophosphatase MutT (NUDIX family)